MDWAGITASAYAMTGVGETLTFTKRDGTTAVLTDVMRDSVSIQYVAEGGAIATRQVPRLLIPRTSDNVAPDPSWTVTLSGKAAQFEVVAEEAGLWEARAR